ncbi:RNA polymerase sigma factor RpoD/SigA [Treponema sp.]|uniref:sigma-70 family RNA polymerase sigma factor n=1 Tax=Treponema sp. TaxID=166 RepID=UPI00298DFFB7|nr:RNA polymerase sigma factor RpoD/SigA [Treponema sp.]MCQ2240769.1 RNA polymerase sigma factor RpoD/SigA [Treponema sp.]
MKKSSVCYDDVVKMHLNEVKRYPLLTPEQETEAAKKALKGDKKARDLILTSNMRFVIKVAAQYRNRGLDFEDLISEGYIGLMKALEHFDVSKGFHFISYAVWWIRQSILKAILDTGRAIRLPVNKEQELSQIKKAVNEVNPLGQKSEAEELDEVASMLGMTQYHVREMLEISRDMKRLDRTLTDDSETTLLDTIESEFISPEESAINQSLTDDINAALDTMDKKSATVLAMRYGLNGYGERTLKEVGEKLNLSRERVRQIEKKAVDSLKDYTAKNKSLRDYVVA